MDRWELMEYLWEKEREIDFTFWLEKHRREPSFLNPPESRFKEPWDYFASEKCPWILYPVPKGHPRDDGSEQLFRVKKAASWADLPKEAPKKSTKELIPKEYHEFLHTFEQKASE